MPVYSYVYYGAVDYKRERIGDRSWFANYPGRGRVQARQSARRQPRSEFGELPFAIDPRAPVGIEHEARQKLQRAGHKRDVAALQQLQLAGLSRRDRSGLRAGSRVRGGSAKMSGRYDVPCCHVDGNTLGLISDSFVQNANQLYPALSGVRDLRDQTHGRPLDDAARLLNRAGAPGVWKGPGASGAPTPVFTTTDAYPERGWRVPGDDAEHGERPGLRMLMVLPKCRVIANFHAPARRTGGSRWPAVT